MTETDAADQAHAASWERPITREELKLVLSRANISNTCNLCNDYKWYYIHTKDDGNHLSWTCLLSGDIGNQYQILSYYTRTCLNCGNMQNFARVVINRLRERLNSQEN